MNREGKFTLSLNSKFLFRIIKFETGNKRILFRYIGYHDHWRKYRGRGPPELFINPK